MRRKCCREPMAEKPWHMRSGVKYATWETTVVCGEPFGERRWRTRESEWGAVTCLACLEKRNAS